MNQVSFPLSFGLFCQNCGENIGSGNVQVFLSSENSIVYDSIGVLIIRCACGNGEEITEHSRKDDDEYRKAHPH